MLGDLDAELARRLLLLGHAISQAWQPKQMSWLMKRPIPYPPLFRAPILLMFVPLSYCCSPYAATAGLPYSGFFVKPPFTTTSVPGMTALFSGVQG